MTAGAAATPPPETGAQPDNGGQPDPWTGALEGVDEVHRPFVEQAINPLREQFTPRLELAERLEPLGEYADDLLGLIEDVDEESGANGLQALLTFLDLTNFDPEQPDSPEFKQFAEWWEGIGEEYGLFDDDDGDGGDDPAAANGQGNPETAELRELVGSLQAKIEQLESGGRQQQEAQRIQTQVEQLMAKHGIEDDEAGETRSFILRLAGSYVEQPNMVELAVADYLKLTGKAQQGLLGGEKTETVTAGASPRGGTADHSPEEVTTGDPIASRRRASELAKQRLRAAG